MHRRQYIPGSHVKRNRTRLEAENKQLLELARAKEAEARAHADRASNLEANAAKVAWRKFVEKTKRVLTSPIKFGRNAA